MSTRQARAAATAMAGLLLTLTACNGDDPAGVGGISAPSAASTTSTAPEPTTTTTAATTTVPAPTDPTTTTTVAGVAATGDLAILDAVLDADGTLGLQEALALFAAGYAPVPGVEAAPTPLLDGTPVLRTLLGHLDQLSEAQRVAVIAITDQPGVALAEVGDDPRLSAAAGTIQLGLTLFAEFLGRSLRDDVALTIAGLPYANADGTKNFSSPNGFARALPFAVADGETYDECRISVNLDAPVDPALGFEDPSFLSAVASAAFHCLQYGLVGPGADIPLWVMEGAAAFAGEEYIQGSPRSGTWWARWIGEPARPLHRRTYDAAGFFALLKSHVDSVWKYTDIFLGDADPVSLVRRLEGTGVLDRWGTQYATEPSWGRAYTVGGFGAPPTPAPALPITLDVDGHGVTLGDAASILAGSAYRGTVPGDILVVTTEPGDHGGLRFADGTEASFDTGSQAYCLVAGTCVCPGAAPEETSATDVASAELFVGVGPSPGGGPTLAARSLAQWCNEVLVPAPPGDALDQCLARRWTSNGYEAPETPGVRQEITGGAGALLDLRPDRTVTVDMNATTPVVFTHQDAQGVVTTTSLEYKGSGTGTWSAADGVIGISGVDTSSFTVRLRIDMPGGQLTDVTLPATDTRLARFAGLLGTGRYVCSAVSMTLTHVTPGVGGESGFTFQPA